MARLTDSLDRPGDTLTRHVLAFSLKTWNCFGVPQGLLAFVGAKGPPDAHRLGHSEVLSALADHEIVCFQELWLAHAERLFVDASHPHKVRDDNRASLWPFTVAGSGLGIASRFRVSQTQARAFSRSRTGADRFTRKGMLHARVALTDSPPIEIDVVTTHLQAGESRAAERVRARQLSELRVFVDEIGDPARACYLCGDFNIDGLDARRRGGQYLELHAALAGFDDLGAVSDRPTFHPFANRLARRYFPSEPDQRIDYVWFRPSQTGRRIEIDSVVVAFDSEPPASAAGPSTFASDHYALTAHCRLV